MSRLLRHLTSLRNLGADTRPSGQIATLLLLATTMLLIFVMVTINIGNVSTQSTEIANAADSSALYLGSALATKARQVKEGLGGWDMCQDTGYASIVIAVIVAIIAIVLTVMTCGAGAVAVYGAVGFWATAAAVPSVVLTGVGAVAGAVGGYIGAEIAGTDREQGIYSGAAVGAAVGSVVSLAAGASTGGLALKDLTYEQAAAYGGGTVPVHMGELAALQTTGLYGALSATGGIYNEKENQRKVQSYMNDIYKALGKASETDRIRETAILKTMASLADDPNNVVDSVDSDFDGNTQELVPALQVWMYNRAEHIRELTDVNESTINMYMTRLQWMRSYLWWFIAGSDAGNGAHQPGYLETQDYRFVLEQDAAGNVTKEEIVDNAGNDGVLAAAFRALEANTGCGAACDLSFWDSRGPTAATYNAYVKNTCSSDDTACLEVGPPLGYDQFDAVLAGMRAAVVWIDTLASRDPKARAATWDQWAYLLYDEGEDPDAGGALPDRASTLYGKLYQYENAMKNWQNELSAKRSSWPVCVPDGSGGYANPPCRTAGGASFDQDTVDEYATAQMYLQGYVVPSLQWSRGYLKDLVTNLRDAGTGLNKLGGKNPVVYQWDDTRGHHWVKTKIGNFLVPAVNEKDYGNWFSGETCLELSNFTSEKSLDHKGRSSAAYEKCWVQVWRYDQPKAMGLLGTWNPFRRPLTKKASCYYSFDRVGLKDGSTTTSTTTSGHGSHGGIH